jgi:hypothetical protein
MRTLHQILLLGAALLWAAAHARAAAPDAVQAPPSVVQQAAACK